MPPVRDLARAVVAELVSPDGEHATVAHWWSAMTPEERQRAMDSCVAAAERAVRGG